MKEKEIDINNENEILEKFDFNYCYNSEKCSRELCMFFNDVCMTKRKNFDKRQAFIDLGIIAITLNQQDKRIKELEEFNLHLQERIGRQYDKIEILEKAFELACEPRDDWGGSKYSGTEFDNYHDYFIAEAEKELKGLKENEK